MTRGRRLARLALGLGLIGLLVACAPGNGRPKGDPVRMAESEVDIAADLWWRQNQPREALKHALEATELDSKNGDAAHMVGLIYLHFCQFSEPDECHLDQAERFARRAIALREEDLQAKNTLGVILVHQQRFEEAIAVLKPITEDILYPTPEIAWGNLGWAYLDQGDLKRAVPALRRAIAAQPLFCVGNYRLGVAYHRSGQLEAAVDALDRALETQAAGCQNLQDAYLERARVHIALGDVAETRVDLDRCLVLAKSNTSGRECGRLLASLP
jgi:type IV pilus assembly protein PilF